MTPEQCKKLITDEYNHLKSRKLPPSVITAMIIERCKDAAHYSDMPSNWKEYLPDELKNDENYF